ncbi:MAG: asparagine synthase-related protein [Jatrophihabitans sp.]
MTTLTGCYGVRADSTLLARLSATVRATAAECLTGIDPCGGRWLIAALPDSTEGGDRDRSYRVGGPNRPAGVNGLVVGRLFRTGAEDGAAPPADQLADWLGKDGQLPERAWGRYGGAAVTAAGELIVFRDPIGLSGCYYLPCGTGVAFSTHTATLAGLLDEPVGFDWDFIASMVLQQHFPAERTSLARVRQVLPGGLLRFGPQAPERPTVEALWNPVEVAGRELAAEPGQVAEALRRCTRAWLGDAATVGIELSGGLDSSAVAWAVRQVSGPELHIAARTLYHSGLASADERRYAAAVAESVGAELRTLDAAAASPLDRALLPGRRWDCATMHAAELRMIEQFADGLGPQAALLSGGGGDQVFLSRAAGSPQLADHLRHRGPVAGLREVIGEARTTGQPLPQLARTALGGAVASSPRRLARRTGAPAGVRFATPAWLDSAFVPLQLSLPAGIERLPAAKREQVVGIGYWAGGVDRDHRPGGKPVIYPLLSQPLVELALRTPSHRLVDHRRDRIVLRDAVEPALPAVVNARTIKSEYSGLYHRAVRRNVGYLRELLLDGHAARAGVVDRHELIADLSRTALGARPDPGWPLIALIAAETWCRAWA